MDLIPSRLRSYLQFKPDAGYKHVGCSIVTKKHKYLPTFFRFLFINYCYLLIYFKCKSIGIHVEITLCKVIGIYISVIK